MSRFTADGDTLLDAGEQLRKLGAGDESVDAGSHEHPPPAVGGYATAGIGAMLAARISRPRTGDERVRHTCFDSRDGELKIELMRAGSWVNCRVTDNGSGLGRIKLGRGLRIVGDLASSLGGRIDRSSGPIWNSFSLDFPLTQREQRANRTVAGRRPRTGRRSKAMPSLPSAPVVGERATPVTQQPQL
jgi:hypothetical protein